jgi:hypothetical protein
MAFRNCNNAALSSVPSFWRWWFFEDNFFKDLSSSIKFESELISSSSSSSSSTNYSP